MEGKKGVEGVDLEGLRLSTDLSLELAERALERFRKKAGGGD
jgi:hypothetical protein